MAALSKEFHMKIRVNRPLLLTGFAICGLALGACQSHRHIMVEPKPGQTVVCTKCYDQIHKARRHGGPTGGLATNRMITTHMCEECKTTMSIYTEDGVLMVKCANCAPTGLPCDKCLPPETVQK